MNCVTSEQILLVCIRAPLGCEVLRVGRGTKASLRVRPPDRHLGEAASCVMATVRRHGVFKESDRVPEGAGKNRGTCRLQIQRTLVAAVLLERATTTAFIDGNLGNHDALYQI